MGKFSFKLVTKTVKELKEIAKAHGIKGYSAWKKDVLIEELSKIETEIRNAEYKKACQAECTRAKELIGEGFGPFYRLYQNIKGRKLRIDEYDEMVLDYKIISYLVDGNVIDGSLDSLVIWFSQKLRPNGKKEMIDLSTWTDEQKRTYIQDSLNDIVKSITTETLKKKSVEVMKVSFNDIKFKDNGEIIFDSSKAVKLKAEELAKLDLSEKKAMMRWVSTLEDASTRILQPLNKQIISITMDTTNLDEEDGVILKRKERLLAEGVKDIATDKHYNFTLQSASGKRKASFLYADLTKEEVFNLWFKLTGTKNREGFYKTFRNKDGKVNVSKMNTRLASRVSNSLDLENGFTEEHIKELRGLNVLYIPDAKSEVITKYKTIVGPDLMEEKEGLRALKGGDGQVSAKIKTHVLYAKFNRLIDNGEYDLFCHLWKYVAEEDMEKAKENKTLMKILSKVPGVFQLRHGADKGISVWCNYEHIEITLTEETAEKLNKRNLVETPFVAGQVICLGDYDMLIPDSVRKYIAGEWKDYPLEICNHLKKKKGWVNLNQQFIDALNLHPSSLIPIVDYWIDFALDSLDSIEKTMVFHNIMFDEDIEEADYNPDEEMSEEDKKNIRNVMPKAVRANILLAKDPQVMKWRKAPYDKLVKDLLMGRIKVPGMYTYMVCDPFFVISNVFGVKLPCLQSGENYFNNKDCYVGLFRSPLIAEQNAQKAKVVSREDYWYFKDVIVFNGFDGQWEFMSGADFDGDTCAVIPDDTDFGKTIVDGIVSKPDVYEAGFDGIEVPFDFDDLSDYYKDLARTANPDRTGILTNFAVRSNQIAKHLLGLIDIAKDAGVSTITLIHPKEFGMKTYGFYGSDYVPKIRRSEDTLRAKGFVFGYWDKEERKYLFDDEHGITGRFTFEEIEQLAESFTTKCEYSSIIVYREIDSAKTSITAEGYAWCMAVLEGKLSPEELKALNEYTDSMKTMFSSNTFLVRSVLKTFSDFDNTDKSDEKLIDSIPNRNRINSYVSMSPLGRAFYRVNQRRKEIAERFGNEEHSVNLNSYLLMRLTKEELADLYRPLQTKEHGMQNIIQCLERRRTMYNKAIHNLNLIGNDKQDGQNSIEKIKTDEVRFLRRVANYYKLSLEVVAVACYIVTYSRDTKEGLTYAWLLPNTLLSVFRRGDESFISVPVTSTDLCIKDGWLYENGKKRTPVDADNSDFVPVIGGADRMYAYIKKNVSDVVNNNNISVVVPGNQVYTIKALGFKHHKSETPSNWLSMVTNKEFEIKLNELGRVCAFIGEDSISMIEYGQSFELLDKTVRMINQPTPDKNSIRDIQVVVVK